MYVSREERNGLTKEYLNELFEYQDGSLYWKVAKGRRVHVGDRVGNDNGNGHLLVQIDGETYRVHRLIFLMHHEYLPKFIDHKNNIRDDNRIENLREATRSENGQNSIMRSDNKSGVKGVYWHRHSAKWRVQISVNGKRKYFGCYDDIDLAELVAIEAREKYHGEFARHS